MTTITATQAPAARAERLTKIYGSGLTEVTALDQVSLEIGARSFTAVMGPSGSGKSTLMHCMAGLDTANGGQVWIGSEEITALPERQLTRVRRDHVGFVFQTYNLLPVLSAADNITLPLDIAGRSADREWLSTVIETVGLTDRLRHRPTELSGGQQQRVAIARALAGRPEIIFADEPTGNLDSRAGAEVLDLLRRCVREFGQTIVMVTHDPVAASYADRVVFLADGRIAGELDRPTPQTVLDRMRTLGSD
jgi:putative ABC transport system ATP-binding protein